VTISPGLIAPLLTPFNDDGSIALDLYVDHAHRLLKAGCVALTPFGTTGEGPSIAIEERINAVDALVGGGVSGQQLVIGTGTPSVVDTIALTQHAADLGAAAVLVLPPFYFRSALQEGLEDYFAQVATAASIPVYLYHIPQVAGIGIPPSLVRALAHSHTNIVGIKDSTGDWEHTRHLFDVPDFIVYPGSELPLLEALAAGGPGCISATANTNAAAIAQVIASWRLGRHDRAREEHAVVSDVRRVIQQFSPIQAQKALLARRTEDARWSNLRAPLRPLDRNSLSRLLGELEQTSGQW